MKTRLFLFSILFFTCRIAYAGLIGDAVRNIDRAAVKIMNFCEYSVSLKDPASGGFPRILMQQAGNGFIIEHKTKWHIVLTAKHVVDCSAKIEEVFPADQYPNAKSDKIESFNARSKLSAIINSKYFPAHLADYDINKDKNIDFAIVDIDLPDNFPHYHIPVLTDKDTYDLGSAVIVRGFMPCKDQEICDGDGWVKRLKAANIEGLSRDKIFIQLNTTAYSGMSGSPVLIFKKNKYYAIGIVVIAYLSEEDGAVDISWATRIKKEYFDLSKKP